MLTIDPNGTRLFLTPSALGFLASDAHLRAMTYDHKPNTKRNKARRAIWMELMAAADAASRLCRVEHPRGKSADGVWSSVIPTTSITFSGDIPVKLRPKIMARIRRPLQRKKGTEIASKSNRKTPRLTPAKKRIDKDGRVTGTKGMAYFQRY